MVRYFILHFRFNPFKPNVGFHIESSPLFCSAKQITGFQMKSNTGLKQVNQGLTKLYFDSLCLTNIVLCLNKSMFGINQTCCLKFLISKSSGTGKHNHITLNFQMLSDAKGT